jgi:hypothetical protein
MNNKTFVSAAILAIIFLIGAFAYNKNQTKIQVQNERENAIQQEVQRPTETLNVKYQRKGDRNVYVGSVFLPTPCHSLTVAVGTQTEVNEIIITTKASQEICAQVITERTFKVETDFKPEDNFVATLNGEVVNFNILEIPANQDIDDIEIFIKG